MLYSCITSSPLALAIRRAACVASHTAHAEACLSARQNFLATEFPVTPGWCSPVFGSTFDPFLLGAKVEVHMRKGITALLRMPDSKGGGGVSAAKYKNP